MIVQNPNSGVAVDIPLSAFNDLRTIDLLPVAGWQFNYNINSDLINTTLTGSGSATASNAKGVLQTGATANSSATIQTVKAVRHIPGLGKTIRFTGIFTAGVPNSTQVIGIGDSTDGYFFGYNGASFGVLRRQNGVDNWISQSSWNYDAMTGSGPSKMTLNPTLGNVYEIRFQWLGFGVITFWVYNSVSGAASLVHTIQYPNTATVPSTYNPTLPLIAQVKNTANTSNLTLQTSSAMGFVEGNGNTNAMVTRNSFSNAKTGISTTPTSIFTLLNKNTFQGKTNRIRIQFDYVSLQTDSGGNAPATCRLVKNGTLGGAPVFNDISTNTSVMAVDTSGTTVTGGSNVLTFGINTRDSVREILTDLDIQLEPGSTFSLVCFSSSGSQNFNIAASWKELW
ncbi:hypothetical protein QTL97_16575 [Sporosarcina thermotolerans]|uniref:Uncharacterized protein n=1 Tax=Sporosarcina thermotolerans TaxID=633404 RepID=A0AAW9AA83_9BACL|nr:hypothetical protein [Sporosarcina thermotolerans]MDW0118546.1 hypothetical protein [Sporosarcina thermotolerans]